MDEPWMMAFPVMADRDRNKLFMSLGRTLDRWEWVELGLAFMYSLFVTDPTFRKVREYGEGRKIFRDRMDGLKKAADRWFVRHPSQNHEIEFDEICRTVCGFAERRNEFAHGLVSNVTGVLFWMDKLVVKPDLNKENWLITPALHTTRKHGDDGMPTYGYSSLELNAVNHRLEFLERRIDNLMRALWPHQWPIGLSGPSLSK